MSNRENDAFVALLNARLLNRFSQQELVAYENAPGHLRLGLLASLFLEKRGERLHFILSDGLAEHLRTCEYCRARYAALAVIWEAMPADLPDTAGMQVELLGSGK